MGDMADAVDLLEGPDAARSGMGVTGRAVLREVQKRIEAVDHNNVMTSLGAKANTFSYAQSLMSLSHLVTSTMEAHTNAVPLLGARHGFGATIALSKALAQAGPKGIALGVGKTIKAVGNNLRNSDWNLGDVMRDRFVDAGANKSRMTDLFNAAKNAGLIDHTMLKDLQLQARSQGKAWNYFQNLSQASAHSVDVMNKSVILKAAYDLEYARGMKPGSKLTPAEAHAKAVDYAMETTRQAMPNYNLANKPRIATQKGMLGALGAPLMQFKMYGMHQYTVLANLAKQMMTGDNKAEAAKAFAGILATHAMTAGVLGLPFSDALRYILGGYDLVTGKKGPQTWDNLQNETRGFLADTFGKPMGEAIARGLPHLLGFDVHHRVGLENMLEMPEMSSFDKGGIAQVVMGLATGATGENLVNVVDGLRKALSGDVLGAATTALPRPIRDVVKAGKLGEQGVVTAAGRTILPASKISAGDVAYQALGFQPSKVTEAREASYAVQQARDEAKQQHTDLTKAWIAAKPVDRAAIMSQIRTFNADPKSQGFRITVDQMLKTQAAQAKAARAQGVFGLTVPKKAAGWLGNRQTGPGAFANVP
jgi:hypothetical protein